MMEASVSDLLVLDHEHDEDGKVYRIVVGREVRTPAYAIEVPLRGDGGELQYDLEEGGDGHLLTTLQDVPEGVVGVVDVRDYVFADDDERWFETSGERVSDEEAVSIQKQLIKDAIQENVVKPAKPPARKMPGVGEPL